MAFRSGISLRAETEDEEDTRNFINIDTSLFDQKLDISNTSIQLMAQYLKYFNPNDEIKLFFEIGAQFNIYNLDGDDVRSYGNVYGYDKIRVDDRYQIGLTSSLGVEWFIKNNMSLHAEYGLYAYYFYYKYHRITVFEYLTSPDKFEERKVESHGWRFDDAGALFGLSVYF